MNREKVSHRFTQIVLAIAMASGLLGFSAKTAAAQSIIVTTPFSFSVENQHYAAGTYEFTLPSDRFLSIRNVNGGPQEFFLVCPGQDGPLGVRGGVIFQSSNGHRILESVYVPGTDISAVLMEPKPDGDNVNAHETSSAMRA